MRAYLCILTYIRTRMPGHSLRLTPTYPSSPLYPITRGKVPRGKVPVGKVPRIPDDAGVHIYLRT